MSADYKEAWEGAVAMYREQKAENERLRAALTEISELYSGGHGYRAKEIATRALQT